MQTFGFEQWSQACGLLEMSGATKLRLGCEESVWKVEGDDSIFFGPFGLLLPPRYIVESKKVGSRVLESKRFCA